MSKKRSSFPVRSAFGFVSSSSFSTSLFASPNVIPASPFCFRPHAPEAAPRPPRGRLSRMEQGGACRRSAPFRCAKPRWPVTGPTGAAILPSPSRLRRAGAPTAKPRRLSPFGSISPARNRAAGRFPRRGQRARCPIFALLKCGPAFSRGVCRGTFPCSPAGPALAPRRLSPFGSISLRETALAGRCPRRGQRARYPIFALLKCGPALAPRRSAPFHPKTIVRFRMSVSPEFSVFFICPPPFFCIGSGAHRYTKIRGGVSPPRI